MNLCNYVIMNLCNHVIRLKMIYHITSYFLEFSFLQLHIPSCKMDPKLNSKKLKVDYLVIK